MTRAGTSKTASRPPSRARRTIMRPAATTSPGSAPRSVTVPGPSAIRVVKPSWFSAVSTWDWAASTWAWAASRASTARSNSARATKPCGSIGSKRRTVLRASTRRAMAAARLARAASTALRSLTASRRATTCPAVT